jgi:hypothetical protein
VGTAQKICHFNIPIFGMISQKIKICTAPKQAEASVGHLIA